MVNVQIDAETACARNNHALYNYSILGSPAIRIFLSGIPESVYDKRIDYAIRNFASLHILKFPVFV